MIASEALAQAELGHANRRSAKSKGMRTHPWDAGCPGWAAMESAARPGQPLHIGHESIVILVRMVVRILLHYAKDASRCLTFLLTA